MRKTKIGPTLHANKCEQIECVCARSILWPLLHTRSPLYVVVSIRSTLPHETPYNIYDSPYGCADIGRATARTHCTESHFLDFLVPSCVSICLSPTPDRRFIIARAFSQIHHINIAAAAVVVRPTTSFYSRCSATVFLSLPLLGPRVCTIPTPCECPTTKTNILFLFLLSLLFAYDTKYFLALENHPTRSFDGFVSRLCAFFFLRILSVDAWPLTFLMPPCIFRMANGSSSSSSTHTQSVHWVHATSFTFINFLSWSAVRWSREFKLFASLHKPLSSPSLSCVVFVVAAIKSSPSSSSFFVFSYVVWPNTNSHVKMNITKKKESRADKKKNSFTHRA